MSTDVDGAARVAVAVVGGGIAGVAAAHELTRRHPGVEVTVFDGADRLGGKLHRHEVGGITVDVGAEAMLNRRHEAVDLVEAVGLGERVVHPATTSSMLWNRDRLVPLPKTLMGVPGDDTDLSQVLSRAGMIRAAMEPRLPATELGDADVSIGHLVEERFGKEVVDRLVEPLLGGVYAGHAREISARAAVPGVVAMLDGGRSLSRAAQQALSGVKSGVPVFAGLRGGVGQLPMAVAQASGARVRLGASVRDLVRTNHGWRLVVGDARSPELVEVDAVVLATPAPATARLLSDVAPTAALNLARIEYASMAIVTMAFAARAFPPIEGSGFLVPPVDKHAIKAATFSHQKWAWVGVADPEIVVMRCSLGRHREEAALQASDDELVALALRDLTAATGLSTRPIDEHVQRWGGGLPQYSVGHLDRIAHVRAEIAELPGLAVCGAAYDGLGIPACIASAHRAVAGLADHFGRLGA